MAGLESSGGFSPHTSSTWTEMTQSLCSAVTVTLNTYTWPLRGACASHSLVAAFCEGISRGMSELECHFPLSLHSGGRFKFEGRATRLHFCVRKRPGHIQSMWLANFGKYSSPPWSGLRPFREEVGEGVTACQGHFLPPGPPLALFTQFLLSSFPVATLCPQHLQSLFGLWSWAEMESQ